jgi:hypothetical protein
MKRTLSISWIVLAAVLMGGLPSGALADDQFLLQGETLSEDEMAEARGGLSLPGGGYMEFSMDYLRLQFLGSGDPASQHTSAWVNSISQRATITDEGIKFSMDILQGYSGGESGDDSDTAGPIGGNNLNARQDPGSTGNGQGGFGSSQTNNILAKDSLTGFTGLANTNLIAGNYNSASIVNIFNIKVNFFNANDFKPLTALGLVLH